MSIRSHLILGNLINKYVLSCNIIVFNSVIIVFYSVLSSIYKEMMSLGTCGLAIVARQRLKCFFAKCIIATWIIERHR